eukprot:COSAG01_NODE_6116_length_3845_cov_144.351590_4_plen_55_part_00
MYSYLARRAKDESADLLSCCWLIPEKSAEFSESILLIDSAARQIEILLILALKS